MIPNPPVPPPNPPNLNPGAADAAAVRRDLDALKNGVASLDTNLRHDMSLLRAEMVEFRREIARTKWQLLAFLIIVALLALLAAEYLWYDGTNLFPPR